MNDCLINPYFFYWIGVVDCLVVFSVLLAIVFGFVSVGFTVAWIANRIESEDGYQNHQGLYRFYAILFSALFLLFASVSIFVPTRETLIEMEIAKQVTHSNIKIAKEEIKSVVDYIFSKTKELKQ